MTPVETGKTLGLVRPPVLGAVQRFTHPSGFSAPIIFLENSASMKATAFLKKMRVGEARYYSRSGDLYRSCVSNLAKQLATAVARHTGAFDAILAPPSEDHLAGPYRQALFEKLTIRTDMTNRFGQHQKLQTEFKSNLNAVANSLTYSRQNDEAQIGSLLFVDDSIWSGDTVAAMVAKLQDCGLRTDCKVTVAVALWITE